VILFYVASKNIKTGRAKSHNSIIKIFNGEKFCILLDYKITKDFLKNNHFEDMTAG
jgi:hypothetical protein